MYTHSIHGGPYSEIVVEADICLETTRGSGGQGVPIAIPELQLHLIQELVNIRQLKDLLIHHLYIQWHC